MKRRYPEATWVRNARYVIDGPVMSSSGVSASVPVTLKLLEILAGETTAREVAADFGLDGWSADHDSSHFTLDREKILVATGNLLGFWRHEVLQAGIEDGFDGIVLALQADAWSRTYRSRLVAVNRRGRVTSAEGVTFLTEAEDAGRAWIEPAEGAPFVSLDANLGAIAERYGLETASFVATQLEYGWPRSVP